MINERLRLSVGGTPVQRVFLAGFGLVFAAVGVAFVVLPLLATGVLARLFGGPDERCTFSDGFKSIPADQLPPELADCQSREAIWAAPDSLGTGPMLLIGLCGLPFVLLGLFMVLRVLRAAAWLEGTRLRVRGAFGSRSVDLATAELTGSVTSYLSHGDGPAPRGVHRQQEIIARDPATGRRVTLSLSGVGSPTLPSHELRALADAMTAGRPTDGRHADAHTVAGQLRTMAANPLGL